MAVRAVEPAASNPLPAWMLTRRFALLVLTLVGGTTIPGALYMLYTVPALRPVGFSTGIVFFIGWVLVMYYKVKENRAAAADQRNWLYFATAMEEHSYKCIKPQVLGSWVTLPVRVALRGTAQSRLLDLGEEVLEVELANVRNLEGEVDQEKALKNLFFAAINDDRFALQVRIGGGKRHAGPTGLGVLVGFKDFGTDLAYTMGHKLEDAIRRRVTAV